MSYDLDKEYGKAIPLDKVSIMFGNDLPAWCNSEMASLHLFDHAEIRFNGECFTLIGRPYDVSASELEYLLALAKVYNLDASILGTSNWNAGCMTIVLTEKTHSVAL